MRALRALVLVFLLAGVAPILPTGAAAQAEKRVALVIGNGDYRNAPRLPNPRNDAEDVAAALKRSGFETIVGIDLDRNQMNDAAIRFARAARAADVALFYYSGHAMQFAGVNYLMPVDTRLADEADLRTMTRIDDILADLQQAKNLRILILDSCRDNPLAEDLKRSVGRTRATSVARGLAKIDSPQGMIVAYATQAGKTADDGTGRNSPYTSAFLKHIETQSEVGTVFRRVSEDVYAATKREQLPELSLSLIGEFYLNGRAPAAGGSTEDLAALRARLKALEEQIQRDKVEQKSGEQKSAILVPPVQPSIPAPSAQPAVGTFDPKTQPAVPPARNLKIRMQTGYAQNDVILNEPVKDFTDEVRRLSGGQISIEVLSAGSVVPVFQLPDAVASGSLDAGFSLPALAYGKSKAFAVLDGAMPFGHSPEKLLRWYQGDGQRVADQIYAKFKLKMIPCGVFGSQGGGWYPRLLNGNDAYRGLKLRSAGFHTEVFQAAGASVVVLPGGEMLPALERGLLDSVEFAWPLTDHGMGFQRISGLKHYYFPSWHHPASIADFTVSLSYWDRLSVAERGILEQACRTALARSLARIPQREQEGLDALRRAGVDIRQFPDSVLTRAKRANEAAVAAAMKDPDFKAAYESYNRAR